MILQVKTSVGQYPILLERGALARASEFLSLNRKCMIVSDENIPDEYVNALAAQCKAPSVFRIAPGEHSKTLASFEAILRRMLNEGFSRGDCVVALGGGVVGDLAGFVASAFMRGVDFYNVPTTLLSQVDSSIGGKVAVNFDGLKNMVGAFYPPKAVLIDPETLKTLPDRQISAGLAESVKMALTSDEKLFSLFEEGDPMEHLDEIIAGSLAIKRKVVEEDEKETGLRRILNFGHTLGHGMESESHKTESPLYHGEAVALGMLPMCAPEVRARLIPVLERLGLPTRYEGEISLCLDAVAHDKKVSGASIHLVYVDRVGSFRQEKKNFTAFAEEVKGLQ